VCTRMNFRKVFPSNIFSLNNFGHEIAWVHSPRQAGKIFRQRDTDESALICRDK